MIGSCAGDSRNGIRNLAERIFRESGSFLKCNNTLSSSCLFLLALESAISVDSYHEAKRIFAPSKIKVIVLLLPLLTALIKDFSASNDLVIVLIIDD